MSETSPPPSSAAVEPRPTPSVGGSAAGRHRHGQHGGFGAIFALLAEVQDHFDLPTWGLGVIVGTSFGIAFASQLLLAKQADRGHARRLMIAGVVLAVIGLAWMGLFASTLLEFTLARSILSLGEGALMPAARRVVVLRDPDAAGRTSGPAR